VWDFTLENDADVLSFHAVSEEARGGRQLRKRAALRQQVDLAVGERLCDTRRPNV
jgi:hypothetical protein